MTRRQRFTRLGCAIGRQMATMLAGAVVLMVVAEGFHWGII